jgi:hypothetical protein
MPGTFAQHVTKRRGALLGDDVLGDDVDRLWNIAERPCVLGRRDAAASRDLDALGSAGKPNLDCLWRSEAVDQTRARQQLFDRLLDREQARHAGRLHAIERVTDRRDLDARPR